ncbi:OmpA family protein [Flavobacteriaceae bacterium]|jgi:chemotaxis protein MotB|nr:OmpA family protein [Flavobacteriaceae bacterium]MDA9843906.1 OmpA family protein [Flavobacteriaceae bacterium]MDA9879161.1 OmpA family protein [Flavobacteriaceae bacterium]
MKQFFLSGLVFFLLSFSSCVSTKVFNDLEARYAIVKSERNGFEKSRDSLQQAWDKLDNDLSEVSSYLERSRDSVSMALEQVKQWEEKYVLLKENSEEKIQNSIAQNNALLKEIALRKTELQSRSERVDQLEEMIQNQKQALSELKNRISNALLNFEGKGLTVEQRNGKVYVSMENKLLFKSGRWDIEPAGKQALSDLAKVLEENPDIAILIEGHTDNVPFSPKGQLESNWDLSTKRATAVVNILLENERILPQNLTAAGRSEFLPIGPNSSAEGRASNRRIEVVLSPSLDEITALLETN